MTSYWVLDPNDEVTLTAWELRDGHYEAVAAIAGDEEWVASTPFPVTVISARLAAMPGRGATSLGEE